MQLVNPPLINNTSPKSILPFFTRKTSQNLTPSFSLINSTSDDMTPLPPLKSSYSTPKRPLPLTYCLEVVEGLENAEKPKKKVKTENNGSDFTDNIVIDVKGDMEEISEGDREDTDISPFTSPQKRLNNKLLEDNIWRLDQSYLESYQNKTPSPNTVFASPELIKEGISPNRPPQFNYSELLQQLNKNSYSINNTPENDFDTLSAIHLYDKLKSDFLAKYGSQKENFAPVSIENTQIWNVPDLAQTECSSNPGDTMEEELTLHRKTSPKKVSIRSKEEDDEDNEPYTISLHSDPINPDKDLSITPIGSKYQVKIAPFQLNHGISHRRRPVKLVWRPDVMTPEQWNSYLEKLSEILGEKITKDEAAVNHLVKFHGDVEKAIEEVKKNRNKYRGFFKISMRTGRSRTYIPNYRTLF